MKAFWCSINSAQLPCPPPHRSPSASPPSKRQAPHISNSWLFANSLHIADSTLYLPVPVSLRVWCVAGGESHSPAPLRLSLVAHREAGVSGEYDGTEAIWQRAVNLAPGKGISLPCCCVKSCHSYAQDRSYLVAVCLKTYSCLFHWHLSSLCRGKNLRSSQMVCPLHGNWFTTRVAPSGHGTCCSSSATATGSFWISSRCWSKSENWRKLKVRDGRAGDFGKRNSAAC